MNTYHQSPREGRHTSNDVSYRQAKEWQNSVVFSPFLEFFLKIHKFQPNVAEFNDSFGLKPVQSSVRPTTILFRFDDSLIPNSQTQ